MIGFLATTKTKESATEIILLWVIILLQRKGETSWCDSLASLHVLNYYDVIMRGKPLLVQAYLFDRIRADSFYEHRSISWLDRTGLIS